MATKYQPGNVIPDTFPSILKGFVREILREQPANLYRFGAEYFAQKVAEAKQVPLHEMTAEQLEEFLFQLFMSADADGNGILDKKEFKSVLTSSALGLSKKQIKLLYSEADTDADGVINYREFVSGVVTLLQALAARDAARDQAEAEEEAAEEQVINYIFHGMSKGEIDLLVKEAWTEADVDGSGYLDQKEFKRFLRDLPLGLTRKEINMLMTEVDVDGDNRVSYEEFLPLVHAVLVQVCKAEVLRMSRDKSDLENLISDLFTTFDSNGSGTISVKKCRHALKQADLGLTKFQIYTIVGEANATSNTIKIADFVPVCANMVQSMTGVSASLDTEQRDAALESLNDQAMIINGRTVPELESVLVDFFKAFDTDGSGYLEFPEFEKLISTGMEGTGITFTNQQMQLLLNTADEDDDGRVSYEESIKVALSLLEYQDRERRIIEYDPMAA